MDTEKLKKKQHLKVIISEIIMVITVIVTVIILAFVVSGYWVNSDFKVERNGMMQISSTPTGATVDVDGQTLSWLQRTNTSRIINSGEHTITLTKDGYDSWSKTINVSEGLLYRLHYPRLFLQDRQPEKALDTTKATFATVSPDSEYLLLTNDTTEWSLVDLRDDTLKPKQLDIASYFANVSLASDAKVGLFTGQIISADWDRGSNHILFKVKSGNDSIEWVLIDINNLKNSLNLTKEFGAIFTKVEILDNSASNLLVVQDGNLRKIDVSGKAISSVLVEGIFSFDHYENEVVFSSTNHLNATEASTPSDQKQLDLTGQYLVGYFKLGDSKITPLKTTSAQPQVTISKFYDDMYIATLTGDSLNLYKKDGFTPVSDYKLTFAPEMMEVGHNGEFITMNTDTRIATLDMEASLIREWSVEGKTFDWLDNDMIYTVADGELIVYDFDGLNRRALTKNVSSHFPVTITDNKWLYYFSDDNLVREKLEQ